MKPLIKVRKSDNGKAPWVCFLDLKVGGMEISYAPAYYRTHEAAVRAASLRAKQLSPVENDERDQSIVR